MKHRLGDAIREGAFEQVRNRRLADPAQGQRGERNPELRRREIRVQIIQQFEQSSGAAITGGRQRLYARAAHADQRELCGDEKSIGQDE